MVLPIRALNKRRVREEKENRKPERKTQKIPDRVGTLNREHRSDQMAHLHLVDGGQGKGSKNEEKKGGQTGLKPLIF